MKYQIYIGEKIWKEAEDCRQRQQNYTLPQDCVVAKAIGKRIPNITAVAKTTFRIGNLRFPLPQRATDIIRAFDNKEKPKLPIRFTIEVPNEINVS